MAVSPAVRRYLAQLEKVSNPKAPCLRRSKLLGKQAKITRGPRKGVVRALACSDQKQHFWGSIDGKEMDIPNHVLNAKAWRTSGRGVTSFVAGKGKKGGLKSLGIEYLKKGESNALGTRKTSFGARKTPRVRRFAGFGKDGTGMGPTHIASFASKKYNDVPKGKWGKQRNADYRAAELELRKSRRSEKGSLLSKADLRKLNAQRFASMPESTRMDKRRASQLTDAASFEGYFAARAAAVVAKAERKAKKPASQVKGAPEVSDSAVERAVAQLPAAEVKQVEVLADKLVDAGMPESEVEKLGRLLLVEINKIPTKEGRKAAFRQLEKTLRTAAELPQLGRPRGSKNKVQSAKVAKATGEAMAVEVKEVAKDNGAGALASASNPRRRAMPARHLIRF